MSQATGIILIIFVTIFAIERGRTYLEFKLIIHELNLGFDFINVKNCVFFTNYFFAIFVIARREKEERRELFGI